MTKNVFAGTWEIAAENGMTPPFDCIRKRCRVPTPMWTSGPSIGSVTEKMPVRTSTWAPSSRSRSIGVSRATPSR